MSQAVLSINAGSSSLKFALYPVRSGEIEPAGFSGQVEGLEPGGSPRMSYAGPGNLHAQRTLSPQPGESAFDAALRGVMAAVTQAGRLQLVAVAHRVVHGGPRHSDSVLIDNTVFEYLSSLVPLAPLHQPHNLAGIRACQRAFFGLPQVACFDTAFHAGAPEVEKRFALPESLWQQGVRRYGFHGLSYAYVADVLARRSPRAQGRLLLAHLGNGASLCAVQDGRSVASSMGFSALDGLMMGSRCGSLDAGVVLHLLRQGLDLARIEHLLYRRSGLLGVSGVSADMRTLRADPSEGARRAVQMFTYRVVRECGAMVACLGGVDVLGFTGGIGEHDARLRQEVAERLSHLGVRLDDRANQAASGTEACAIHAPDSPVEVWVVPTDEGRVAARDALRLMAARPCAVPVAAQ